MSDTDPWAAIEAVFPKPEPERPARHPVVHGSNALALDHHAAYVASAIEQEAQRVVDAPEGSRNHTLNRASFSLGQLVGGGVADEAEVVDVLRLAAGQAGLGEVEAIRTIRSGLGSGKQTPRGVPDRPDVDGWVAGLPTFSQPAEPQYDHDTGEVIEDDSAAAMSAIVRKNLPLLDWNALWADESEEEWIVEPLLPARRLVALYSAPKVGKSLLLLELCVAMVTGRPVLGVTLDRPRRVLYVDFENDPKADIRERLQAMGVGPADLERLCYLSFPTLAALDSERGGKELMAAVAEYECEVVVVDTVSRAIAGEENENDTWLSFYRHTGLLMKQAGVSLIRLDHAGKDESKGQRGGSAKSGDVDAVWRMSRLTEDSYRLDCEAARMPIVEKTLVLHRETSPLRHRVDAEGRSAAFRIKVTAAVKALDAASLPNDTGAPAARPVVRATGLKCRNDVIAEAVRQRSNRLPGAVPDGGDSA